MGNVWYIPYIIQSIIQYIVYTIIYHIVYILNTTIYYTTTRERRTAADFDFGF